MHRTKCADWRLLIRLCLFAAVSVAAASADEGNGPPPDPEAAQDVARALSDDEASALVKQLRSLSRGRDPAPLLAALTGAGRVSHEDLHKPLVALLKHKTEAVALAAAELLAVQVVESDRARTALAKAVWKAGWSDRTNDRRYGVRGRALRAYAALRGGAVEDARLRDVRALWQLLIGDPQTERAPGLVEMAGYARDTKDKRLCRLLAEEIDTPRATDVNSPSNPPGEWWERRWTMWRLYHADVVEALEAITGQTFKTTEDARTWFQENETRFGFRW